MECLIHAAMLGYARWHTAGWEGLSWATQETAGLQQQDTKFENPAGSRINSKSITKINPISIEREKQFIWVIPQESGHFITKFNLQIGYMQGCQPKIIFFVFYIWLPHTCKAVSWRWYCYYCAQCTIHWLAIRLKKPRDTIHWECPIESRSVLVWPAQIVQFLMLKIQITSSIFIMSKQCL